jgi:hypothetical protein
LRDLTKVGVIEKVNKAWSKIIGFEVPADLKAIYRGARIELNMQLRRPIAEYPNRFSW